MLGMMSVEEGEEVPLSWGNYWRHLRCGAALFGLVGLPWCLAWVLMGPTSALELILLVFFVTTSLTLGLALSMYPVFRRWGYVWTHRGLAHPIAPDPVP